MLELWKMEEKGPRFMVPFLQWGNPKEVQKEFPLVQLDTILTEKSSP